LKEINDLELSDDGTTSSLFFWNDKIKEINKEMEVK